jgi:hypothetical protein
VAAHLLTFLLVLPAAMFLMVAEAARLLPFLDLPLAPLNFGMTGKFIRTSRFRMASAVPPLNGGMGANIIGIFFVLFFGIESVGLLNDSGKLDARTKVGGGGSIVGHVQELRRELLKK